MPCDQCQVLTINGVATHEQGCPNAWKHPITGRPYKDICFECSCQFEPEERGQRYCCDCHEAVFV